MTPTETIGTSEAAVLYAGPEDAFDAARPVLASLGGDATYLGADPGRAAAYEVALLDLFWTAMSGYTHALALARAEGIAAADLAPHATGIASLLPPIIADHARRLDADDHAGDTSTVTSAAAGIDHVVAAAEGHGIDSGVLRAARAVAGRAMAGGHGDDGFSRLAELLARPAGVPAGQG